MKRYDVNIKYTKRSMMLLFLNSEPKPMVDLYFIPRRLSLNKTRDKISIRIFNFNNDVENVIFNL